MALQVDLDALYGVWTDTPWLRARTILLTVHGSTAYGLNRPESDIDVKGLAVPPLSILHGYLNRFDQKDTNTPTDAAIYGLAKFIRLSAENNPTLLEILYTAPKHWLINTPQADMLRENRHLFLSTKARYSFAGFSFSQLKRMKHHHDLYKNPPTHPPTRAEFGLPEGPTVTKEHRDVIESLVKHQLERWDMDLEPLDAGARKAFKTAHEAILVEIGIASDDHLWAAAAKQIGIDDNLMLLLEKERAFKKAVKDWRHYQEWLTNRNPKRAADEAKFGVDLKHAVQLVRLLRMAKEILSTGEVIVERVEDRDELMSIRNGAWSYEQIIDYAEKAEAELDELYKTSKLQKEPQRQAIDDLCIKITESML